MKYVIPDEVTRHHIAVLGKTGSGKTSTEKLLIEQVVASGARVCVLDTLKSDWWGITSSASGKSPGLPFQILGGPRGHVPLHSSAGKVIGQLVGTGKLPLSIVDMAEFEPGGIQRFFVDFAQSLWKHARGVVYLVIEEAHEIAPKERAGFGAENMAIHWAKKLATGSRTKGIKLVVATQRVQALHNAVLGSCETLIVHRLTMDADQEPVLKWLKGANKAKATEVGDTLSSLPTGTGWICSGEAQIFERVAFPKFKTFDNTATPDQDAAELDVKTAPVDQAALRNLIGEEVKKAEADDPKELRKQIADLKSELAKTSTARPPVADLVEAEKIGFEKGKDAVIAEAKRIGQAVIVSALQDMRKLCLPLVEALDAGIKTAGIAFPDVRKDVPFKSGLPSVMANAAGAPITAPGRPPAVRKPSPAPAGGDGAIGGSEQRIIDAIAWWNVFGIAAPSHAQVGFVSGFSHKSGTWATYLSRLRSKGLIEGRGDLVLTEAGLSAAAEPASPPSIEALHAAVMEKIDAPLRKILQPLLEAYPNGLTHEEAGERAGYSHTSGTWATYLSRLRSLELISGRGELKAEPWLFAR
jgi:hypothetical protein